MENQKSKVNLRICGSESTIVDLDQVQAVNTPEVEYRKQRNKDGSLSVSYQPISHNLLIDKTRKHLDQGGFSIVDECHNLARGGQRYFGLFEVSHPKGKTPSVERLSVCVTLTTNAFLQDFVQGMLLSFATTSFSLIM